MQITAFILDWNCQSQLSQGLWSFEDSQGSCDSFTVHNDSLSFNFDFASLFQRARNALPQESADVLERFLVNFCPSLIADDSLQPDCDLDSPVEWIYSALSPATVRSRLASLLNIDFLDCCRLLATALSTVNEVEQSVIDEPTEIYAFLFMWAAAHGQAASKNWGLVVSVG